MTSMKVGVVAARLPWLRSLRARTALLVSMLALAAAVLASVAALVPMGHQVRDMVGQHELAVLSGTAAALDQDIQGKRTLLRAIAETALPQGGDAVGLQRLLERHAVLREEFDNVLVFDTAGQVIANLAERHAVGDRSANGSRLLRETIATRKGGVSQAFRSPLTGKPAIVIAEPVLDADGKVAFILGGGLSLANPRFTGQLVSSRPGRSAYFAMLDHRGTIIYHPQPDRVLQNVWWEPGGITPVTRRALEGFEGWVEGETKNGQHALIAATHLRRTGWTLLLVYPADEAFHPLLRSERGVMLSMALVTLLAALAGWWLTAILLRPLMRLQRRVEMLSAGTADIDVLDSSRTDEIGSLSRAFFALSQQRQEAEGRLALLTRTDTLTGLNNRRMFEAELPAALARARRAGRGLALAFFDVDHFKRINDTHGHAVGDQVLREFARRLQSMVRKVDTLARLSGDEFVIIFELVDNTAAIEPMLVKLLEAIRRPFRCNGIDLSVTTTVGAAHANGIVSADALLKAADDALYRAKAAGRDTFRLQGMEDMRYLPA